MSKEKEFYSFLRKQLGIKPRNTALYELAFLQRAASIVLPDGSIANNERLEYLGDAIIDAIVADYLFRHFPGEREGFLTQMRSKIVNRAHLDSIASSMGLATVLVAKSQNEVMRKRICGDTFEALMGAMYLDVGYDAAKAYLVERVLEKYVNVQQLQNTETNFKSRIIEWGQKNRLPVEFRSVETTANRGFSAQVSAGNIPLASGTGQSKKEAEQKAAENALNLISTSPDFSADALIKHLEKSGRYR
ncbi:MAG: ribonuclease III [Bacteroidales bacterium]|jgi:ribonuclease-3|nr:ribonuclease III [Bacteroidales bacterium]